MLPAHDGSSSGHVSSSKWNKCPTNLPLPVAMHSADVGFCAACCIRVVHVLFPLLNYKKSLATACKTILFQMLVAVLRQSGKKLIFLDLMRKTSH